MTGDELEQLAAKALSIADQRHALPAEIATGTTARVATGRAAIGGFDANFARIGLVLAGGGGKGAYQVASSSVSPSSSFRCVR